MKKHLISALFALILSFVLFSVGAYAADAETTRAEKLYYNGLGLEEMTMDLTIDYGDIEISQTIYSKGEKAASEVELDGEIIRIIADGGDMIIFAPDFPIIHAKFSGAAELFGRLIATENPEEFSLVFTGEHQLTEQDITYDVETFTDADGNVYRYYFLGDEIKRLETVAMIDDIQAKIIMDIISCEIDESIFDVPWYSINIAPIIMLFSFFGLI